MREQSGQDRFRRWEGHPAFRLLPFLMAALAAVAASIGALTRGGPLPVAVVGVFLAIGAVAVLVAWRRPVAGALFIAALAVVVIAVLYVL